MVLPTEFTIQKTPKKWFKKDDISFWIVIVYYWKLCNKKLRIWYWKLFLSFLFDVNNWKIYSKWFEKLENRNRNFSMCPFFELRAWFSIIHLQKKHLWNKWHFSASGCVYFNLATQYYDLEQRIERNVESRLEWIFKIGFNIVSRVVLLLLKYLLYKFQKGNEIWA